MSVLDIDELPRNPPEPAASDPVDTARGTVPSPRIVFNEVARKPAPTSGLVFAIRTDARHATSVLKASLLDHLHAPLKPDFIGPIKDPAKNDNTPPADLIEKAVHVAYREWGHSVLGAMAESLDYERYGVMEQDNHKIDVHFYNARSLAAEATQRARTLIDPADQDLPVVYITLDELIEKQDENWAEVSFSRLFDISGAQNGAYTARPGKKTLPEQIVEVRELVNKLSARHGRKIPVVLMEDNVRQAKMPNWIIDQLDKGGVFDNGRLAGISTCFCCASPTERQAILHNGKVVPVAMVIDYEDAKVDVATTRDFLFDGFVVQTEEKMSRLPGIFMDIEKLFKIHPDKVRTFHEAVIEANVKFCDTIKAQFGVTPLLSWFLGADAIAHVTKNSLDTPMDQVIRNAKAPAPKAPGPT